MLLASLCQERRNPMETKEYITGRSSSNLSLLTKLLFCFSSVSACIIFVGVSAYYSGLNTISEYRKIALKNLPTSVIAANMRGIAKDLRSMTFRMGFAENTDEELTAIQERISELSDQYADNAREYVALSFIEGEKDLFEVVQAKWKSWGEILQQCTQARMKKTPEGLAEYMTLIKGSFRENANGYFEAINELVLFHQEHARMAREQAEKSAQQGNYLSLALICLGTLCSLFIGYFFGRSLARSLLDVVQRITQAGCQVSQTSQQLSTSSQAIAKGSAEGASSLEETVASIEELSSMVKMNADNAKEAASLSQSCHQSAKNGETEIQNLIGAMSDLSKSSKQIEEIINVIDDIAFQTNLLALNAAVEAARAGEQGKGFAVVAEAVRSLAQRSAMAAKDIAKLIQESVQKIERSTKIADRSGSVLNEIVTSVTKVTQLNEEVATASQEQAQGLIQINSAVNQLDEGTQRNAASAEEAATAAEEMSSQALALQGLVIDLTTIIRGKAKLEEFSIRSEASEASVIPYQKAL
jgi:hypothetical protein